MLEVAGLCTLAIFSYLSAALPEHNDYEKGRIALAAFAQGSKKSGLFRPARPSLDQVFCPKQKLSFSDT